MSPALSRPIRTTIVASTLAHATRIGTEPGNREDDLAMWDGQQEFALEPSAVQELLDDPAHRRPPLAVAVLEALLVDPGQLCEVSV